MILTERLSFNMEGLKVEGKEKNTQVRVEVGPNYQHIVHLIPIEMQPNMDFKIKEEPKPPPEEVRQEEEV